MRRFMEMLKKAGMAALGAVVLTGVFLALLVFTAIWAVTLPFAIVMSAMKAIVPPHWWAPNRRRWEGVPADAVPDERVLKMTVWDCEMQEGNDTYPEIDTGRIMDEFEFVREELFRFHRAFDWRKGAVVEMWVEKLKPAVPSDRARIHHSQIQTIIGVWVKAGPNEAILQNAKRIEVANAADAKTAMGIGAEEYRLIGEAARVSTVVLISHDWGFVCVAEWK